MASLHPPVCDFGWQAPDFNLISTDGTMVSRDVIKGKNGLLVIFICNHCPFVKAIQTRLIITCTELQQFGINSIAIQSNDTINYPADNFERMGEESAKQKFSFPYVWDETQKWYKYYLPGSTLPQIALSRLK